MPAARRSTRHQGCRQAGGFCLPPTRFEAQRLLQVRRGDGVKGSYPILVKPLQQWRAQLAQHKGSSQEQQHHRRWAAAGASAQRHGGAEPPSQAEEHTSRLALQSNQPIMGLDQWRVNQKVALTGMGMRRSWLTMPVDTNTSAMAAPRDRNPPAVPAQGVQHPVHRWPAGGTALRTQLWLQLPNSTQQPQVWQHTTATGAITHNRPTTHCHAPQARTFPHPC